jgi:NADH-quinone oxidoreductase subunit J
MDAIFFMILAGLAVACAVNLVLQRHPIASALSLVGVMASLAGLYLLLGGEFIAMAQLIVYAGAIMVLFVFVIMLLNAGTELRTRRGLWVTYLGVPMLATLVAVVGTLVARTLPPTEGVKFGAFQSGGAYEIGKKLFEVYVFPFEITSVLVLIAIIGAIVLARKEIN